MSVIKAPRFSDVGLPNSDLKLHLTSCPGVRFVAGAMLCDPGFLAEDLARLEERDTRIVLSCLTRDELRLGTARYAASFARLGMVWHVVPIADMSAPKPEHDVALDRVLREAGQFAGTGTLAIHCLGGLGRTGTVSARFAMAHGLTAEQAISFIRTEHDVEAIETVEQEQYLLACGARLLGQHHAANGGAEPVTRNCLAPAVDT